MFYPTISDEHRFVVCHNGKCGSSVVKLWFCRLHGIALAQGDQHTQVYRGPYLCAWRVFARRCAGYHKIIVGRDPWARVVSFVAHWIVRCGRTLDGHSPAHSFAEIVRALGRREPRDPHLALQVGGGGMAPATAALDRDVQWDAVLHMETLEADLKGISERLGLPWDA